jgi:hypothetical protein
MDTDILASFGRHWDVLKKLGDGEPSTFLEAQAVIESIRAKKGYLEPTTMQDVNNMPARSRQNIMHLIEDKIETEAAYTKR